MVEAPERAAAPSIVRASIRQQVEPQRSQGPTKPTAISEPIPNAEQRALAQLIQKVAQRVEHATASRLANVRNVEGFNMTALVRPESPADKFSRLKERWAIESNLSSKWEEMILCPSYLAVIGMGWYAVPIIVKEMREEESLDWIAALEAITEENPVPENADGNAYVILESWLSWADRKRL